MSSSRCSKGLAASLVATDSGRLRLTFDDAENAEQDFSCPWQATAFFTEFALDPGEVAQNSVSQSMLAAIGEAVLVRLAVLNGYDEQSSGGAAERRSVGQQES